MKLRTYIIQKLIEINENIFFYPKLKKFYSLKLNNRVPYIIDVGSNKGQSISFFLKTNQNATIVGFEPNPNLFDKLSKKYFNNPKILIHNKGISSKSGKLMFHQNILDETSTFEQINLDSAYLIKKARVLGVSPERIITQSYEVNVITLSEYITMNKTERIDLIKIDVEGHELSCLKGLFNGLKYPIKYIQLESHNDDMYINNNNKNEINQLLKVNGFNEVARIPHGFGDFYEVIYENTTM
jgi:FkbM family methyltransferase